MTGRSAAGCARLSGLVLALTVVAIGILTPGYRPAVDTVSRLGSPGQPYAAVARAGFVLYGLLVLAGTPAVRGPRRLVGAYGVAAIVAGLAPKDAAGAPHTPWSAIHVDAAVLGGVAIVAAMAVVAGDRSGPSWRRRSSLAAAAITVLAALAFRLCWGSPVYGLLERIVLAVPAVWVGSTALGGVGVLGVGHVLAPRRGSFRDGEVAHEVV
jgi:hypothetical protein